jgi:predicted  nucleic acid-binding Zn-ribbon protein
MKGVKAILLLVSTLFVNLVSAYGEQYGTLIAGVYVDTELVFAAVLFLLFFMCLMIVTRKMNLLKNDMVRIVVSMILSLFAIYGIQKAGIDLSKIVYDIGIERFLMQYFPLILLVLTIVAMLMWGIGTVFMLWGGIFFIAGLLGSVSEDIVYNWEIAMMIGVILFLIGLAINRKIHKKFGGRGISSRNIFKSARRLRRKIKQLQKIWKKLTDKGEYEKANKVMDQIRYLESLLKQLEEEINNPPRERINLQDERNIPQQISPINSRQPLNKMDLARKIGIRNLEKEAANLTQKLQEGWAKAEKLHRLSTSKSGAQWTKSKEGRKYYKDWHKQYQENMQTEKQIKEINQRIQKLRAKIN